MVTPGPQPTISDEELLQIIDDHYAPAVGSGHVAQQADLTQQAVTNRLEQLVDANLLETIKVGQSRVWWLTTDAERRLSSVSEKTGAKCSE
jgi:DNA-binding transcriptional ArsR family regulator